MLLYSNTIVRQTNRGCCCNVHYTLVLNGLIRGTAIERWGTSGDVRISERNDVSPPSPRSFKRPQGTLESHRSFTVFSITTTTTMFRNVLLAIVFAFVAVFVCSEARPQSDWSGSGSILDNTGGALSADGGSYYGSYNNFNSRAAGYNPYFANGLFG
ncbi:unnamed protein product [Bursaphelenchus okinawaensis]|uniref:Uncharacterized protein n=1 Tax=Bursaphelenchus okinawaensis TaxID=465554 RepID=A0A811LRI3_9BILA|nr:unnamed protein product [Bursaphelenchus okinawaensis]CAG9126715.1 unnamed protein product [Bursaphelenchus okinawaensis]